MPLSDAHQTTFYNFQHPNLNIRLALGRKRKGWYLVFAREYHTADCREVARLDKPGMSITASQGENPRFWFNTRAASGWERKGQSLLDLLLTLDPHDPPVLALASSDTLTEEKSGAMLVDVLVPEHRLAHWCENCGHWESIEYPSRWIMEKSGKHPAYICRQCSQKDWFGPRLLRRCCRSVWRAF